MPLDCDDPGALASEAACLDCFGAQQQLAIQTYLLCQIAGMNCDDPQTLVTAAKCFKCLSAAQLQAIQIYLLCLIYNAGTGGGGGCVECGLVNPTAAPASSCCIYYRTDNGAVWFWNGVSWVALITA